MSKISVIIPVYNVEKYLEECIDSVLKQSYRDFEIILVDDGSTDSSGDICDRYALKDERIRVIHKENAGASSARNAGLDIAEGEYVYFLDSDDYIVSEAFEKLIKGIKKGDCDFSFCKAYSFSEKINKKDTENYNYHTNYGIGYSKTFLEEMLKHNEFHVAVWLLLYKKSFLDKNSLRFIEGIMYEDCIFAFQVYCLANKAANVDEFLYYRRLRNGSVMTSKKTEINILSAVKAYEEILAFSESKASGVNTDRFLERIAFNVINVYGALKIGDKRKYKSEYLRIKNSILNKEAFNSKSLCVACKGRAIWIAYKLGTKLLCR